MSKIVTKKIKLANGEMVTVYPVPQRVYSQICARHPYPPVPVLEISGDETATGEPMRFAKENDPEYKRKCDEVDQKRMEEWIEQQSLWGLRDVKVPKGWEPPTEEMQYTDPDWKPRQGPMGLKLDYIELELLIVANDYTKISEAITELTGISEALADVIEGTFPDQVAGESN